MPKNNRHLLDYRFSARPDALRPMRDQLRDSLHNHTRDQETVDTIVLAVNEACMNIIQHAYCAKSDGEIILEVQKLGNQLVFRITDFAPCVDKSNIKGRCLEDIRPGGLGLHFICEVMDSIDFTSLPASSGNVLEMKKRLTKTG